MKLTRFKVMNFRSVDDSGWIDVDTVTALIGINESGKTNLLLPLWKLNPADNGEIEPTSDYPKTMFGEIRIAPGNYSFITAEFTTNDEVEEIAQVADIAPEAARRVQVTRFFDGEYHVQFPEHAPESTVETQWVLEQLNATAKQVNETDAFKKETDYKQHLTTCLTRMAEELSGKETISSSQLETLQDQVSQLASESPAKSSLIVPLVRRLVQTLDERIQRITAPDPGDRKEVLNVILSAMPKFVYYSNYGNLDSEIYLPHVVENLTRNDLGAKEAAKARTLRVLFGFVKLKAQEILELGRDFQDPDDPDREPTEEELEEIGKAKQTRSILLQSAGATLTTKFRDWWKQGDYRFRFEADGNHFRIWVADDRRPTEVELESRSTGLQWFLSFYLVFLFESSDKHEEAVLLLDEPGLSLHPLAQRDLSDFFESLAASNPIIYTAHSPFLVDADRLERARKVYIADDGTTKATPDLRHSSDSDAQVGASYAVYSALNLSVAESLLVGCQPIIVEGTSDQLYLTAIKSLLISGAKITPGRELVFPPSGGVKNARSVASILTGRDENLPVVLLDADTMGQKMARDLKSSLYEAQPERVLSVCQFVEYDTPEIEDLFPNDLLAYELDRIERSPETPLADVICQNEPFISQVQAWATDQGVELVLGWKVKLAKRVKERALAKGIEEFDAAVVEQWVQLFEAFADNA